MAECLNGIINIIGQSIQWEGHVSDVGSKWGLTSLEEKMGEFYIIYYERIWPSGWKRTKYKYIDTKNNCNSEIVPLQ